MPLQVYLSGCYQIQKTKKNVAEDAKLVRVFEAVIERQRAESEACSDLRQDHVYPRQRNIWSPTCVDGQKSFSLKRSEDKEHLYAFIW